VEEVVAYFKVLLPESPLWRRVRIPPLQPCESYKATKRELDAWGYNWANLSLGDMNTGTWSTRLGVERKADDSALQKKNIYIYIYLQNSKQIKSGRNF
jgi:hypothetical protein